MFITMGTWLELWTIRTLGDSDFGQFGPRLGSNRTLDDSDLGRFGPFVYCQFGPLSMVKSDLGHWSTRTLFTDSENSCSDVIHLNVWSWPYFRVISRIDHKSLIKTFFTFIYIN